MEKTLLWEVFCILTKSELRDLDKFVRSPFFNQKAQLIGLFEYLRNCHSGKNLPQTQAAFEAAYPKTVYDDSKMRLANSDLLALIEQYWVVQAGLSDPDKGSIRLAGEYRKRNLSKHMQITLREARKAVERRPLQDADHFQLRYDLELEQFQGASLVKRYESFNLQEISDLLDTSFIAQKLRHVCLSLSHQAVYKTEYRFGLLQSIFDYIEQTQLLDLPAVALYYHACHFLADPSGEDHFFRFRNTLTAHAGVFPQEELRTLYLLAINFGVKKSNEGGLTWFRETFELYREALDRDLLLENGHLSRFAYNNIVVVALRLDELDWTETFIHQYKTHVERAYREQAFNLNLARLAYRRRDYGTALLQLQGADYKDLINSLNAKILLLKIYFETEETDLLESHLESMKTYIHRQDTIGYHRENYLNIVRFTRALVRMNPNDAGERKALREKIETASVLSEREWLLEQLG
jgi:hypothetical protein